MPKSKKHLQTDAQRKLFTKIENHVNYSARTTQDRRLQWKEVWKLWTQYKDPRMPKFRSNATLPIARTAVNTFASFISAKEPTFNVYPIGEEDWLKARFSRELLQYQAAKPEILDLARKSKIAVKSACLFDVGIVKITWKTMTADEEYKDDNGKKKTKKKVLKDYPCLENVHTMDFYPDPYVGRMQDQDMVVESMVVFLDVLRKDPRYTVPADMQPTYTDGKERQEDSSFLNQVDLLTNQGDAETQGKVLVWECWTKTKVYTVADPLGEPVFIREIDNPCGFIPYVKVDFEIEPVPNRFYGYGMLVPNIDINKAIIGMVNNIRDNVNVLVNGMYKIRKGAGIDPRQLVSRPAGFVDVETMGDIEQLRTADTTPTGFNMLNTLSGMFQQGTRVSAVRAGLAGGSDTATEAEIQQSNADTVTSAVKDNFEQALSEIGTMVLKLNIQNMQSNASIRIFDPELIAELQDEYDSDRLDDDQIEEVKMTGTLGGYELDAEMQQEVIEEGRIKPQALTMGDKQRIKKYGKIVKFTKEFFDVDADVMVEADSTMKKDSAVLRKQLTDQALLAQKIPQLAERFDWDEYFEAMADLSDVPAIRKFLKEAPEPMPQMPPEMEGMGGPQLPQVGQQITQQGINQSARSPQFQV